MELKISNFVFILEDKMIFSSFLKLNNEMSQSRKFWFNITRFMADTWDLHVVLFYFIIAIILILNINFLPLGYSSASDIMMLH